MANPTSQTPEFLAPIPKAVRSITLPSRGVLYTPNGPLAKGQVRIAPMTLVEENFITAPTAKAHDGLAKAIQKCVQESIDVNQLLAADKYFIFMMLRAITYGSDYTFNWECSTLGADRKPCNFLNRSTVHIPDEFRVKQLDDADKEPFQVRLPGCGKTLSFRLARGYDEQAIERFETKMKRDKKSNIQSTATSEAFKLALLITAIDDNEITDDIDITQVLTWVTSLEALDVVHYRDKLDFYTPGIDTTVTLTCEECGSRHEMDLPLTHEFFRPELTNTERLMGDEVRPDVLPGTGVPGDSPDISGGTPLVLREIETGEERGERAGETQNRGPAQVQRNPHGSKRDRKQRKKTSSGTF